MSENMSRTAARDELFEFIERRIEDTSLVALGALHITRAQDGQIASSPLMCVPTSVPEEAQDAVRGLCLVLAGARICAYACPPSESEWWAAVSRYARRRIEELMPA